MKFLKKMKDGGPESPVDAYVLCEIKELFSIILLKFNKGCRKTFHSHAFDALTWFLGGDLVEEQAFGEDRMYVYHHSPLPKFTPKNLLHRVWAHRDSWCLTIRGPWDKVWLEYDEDKKEFTTFDWGRNVIEKFREGVDF